VVYRPLAGRTVHLFAAVLSAAYNGGVVNVGTEMIIVMVADEPKRVKHFIEAAQRYNPCEIVRGGVVAIER